MLLGVEIYARSFLSVSLDSFLKTKLLADNVEVADFTGYDFFELNSVIFQDRRVSSSGRKANHKLTDLREGLGTLSIPPAKLTVVKDEYTKAEIVLITNLFKTRELFQEILGIKIFTKTNSSPEIPLNTPALAIRFLNDQVAKIDITEYVRELGKKAG
ncbi:MAG: hypothetical protein ACOWWO_12940 [Peptococcaceae bacterium]